MVADAHYRQLDREGGGVGAFFADGFVGDKPGVAAVADVLFFLYPPADVAFVLVRDAVCEPVDGYVTGFGEVEDEFVAVVVIPAAVDRFVVADGDAVFGDSGVVESAHVFFGECDGFYPVDHVLEDESGFPEFHGDVHGNPGVFEAAADVEVQRAVCGEYACCGAGDFVHPGEVSVARDGVVIGGVEFADVVGG